MASPREAEACGPDFDVDLLSMRPTMMLELPRGVFLKEVTGLVQSEFSFHVVTDEPEGVREIGGQEERSAYDEGARLFHAGLLGQAEARFEALLQLPPEKRHSRSTWAAYMLGRIRVGSDAVHAFQMVRNLAKAGYRDDLGLASASFGAEAFSILHEGKTEQEYANLSDAIALYAQQAAAGDESGSLSLLMLVRYAIAHHRVTELAETEVGQGLMAIYLSTRRFEVEDGEFESILNTLAGSDTLVGASHLAVVAYGEGRWSLAKDLAEHSPSSLQSKRVLAKLALRDGDTASAEVLLAEIEEEQSENDSECNSSEHGRVAIELAAIALKEERAMDAMRLAWKAREHTPDSLYIAERVLTIPELRAFVAEISSEEPRSAGHESWHTTPQTLRSLLARRLMRAGMKAFANGERIRMQMNFSEASLYFGDEQSQIVHQLARWVGRASRESDPIAVADALYRAAEIVRKDGLALLGTSQGPDWESLDAQYEFVSNTLSEQGKWKSEFEKARVAQSAPMYNSRFHYRNVAAMLADRSANFLPTQSHAFAAVLCQGAKYVFNTDRSTVDALYSRYVNHGPRVDFAASFGEECPWPEFVAARRFIPTESSYTWLYLLLSGFGGLGLGWLVFRRRRTFAQKNLGELGERKEEARV